MKEAKRMERVKHIDDGVRLRIQHEDDLWTLSQLVRPGCKVGMMGFRRDASTGTQEGTRAKSADRKPMWIVLDVESTEFQAFTDNLRIHGIIFEAAQDKGSHHTHAVGIRDEVEVSWTGGISGADRDLLKEAMADSGRGRAAIIVVESDEILLFEVAQHGMRDVSQFTLRGGGKREAKSAEVRAAFLAGAARETGMVFHVDMPLVICGPGMAREQFESALREKAGSRRTLNLATSIGGRAAANEVMREGAADAILGEFALAKQVRLIEDAMARMATDGAVAYGRQQIADAIESGAVESLVIEAGLLREDAFWAPLAAAVATTGGEVVQASQEHDAGEQLMGMGGALALLRWKL